MKKQLAVASILVLCLVLAFLIMSCSPGPQNSNTNVANGSSNNSVKTPCSDADIATEMDKIIKNNGIENQHNGSGNPNNIKYFKYRVANDGDKKVLLIEGGISDGSLSAPGGNSEFMEKVVKAIDQLVKKNCVWKAEFVKYGTFSKLDKGELKITDIQGFDWSVCDWPKIACPGGQCMDSCPEMEANMPSNTGGNSNSGSNTNTNSNANVNVNSNANRAPYK